MLKNRKIQIYFYITYLTIGFIGVLASLGVFTGSFRSSFYLFFTNLSNYTCIAIVLAELFDTIKKEKDGYVTFFPALKFIGMLSLLLTFFVFNILLRGSYGLSSILLHIVLPIMYVLDWIIFYEKGIFKWYYPILSVLFPLAYIAFIYIRAAMFNFDVTAAYLYPYFFLSIANLGICGVLKWIAVLLIAFVVLGYIIYGIDIVIKTKTRHRN